MKNNLTKQEVTYLEKVNSEIQHYELDSIQIREVNEQLISHFEEYRDNGEDSFSNLEEPEIFAKSHLEACGIDLHSPGNQLQQSRIASSLPILITSLTSVITFLACQLLFAFTLTEFFNPLNSYQYNLIYRISDNSWWNAALTSTSLVISLIVFILSLFLLKKRQVQGA